MKKLILAALLYLPFITNAQHSSSLDGVLGVDYTYRILFNLDPQFADVRNGEKGKLNYRYGLNYNRKIGAKIWLKTGLRMASIGYKGKKFDGLRYGSEHDGNGGWNGPDPDLPHEIQTTSDFIFLEIPLMIRFEFLKKKFAPFVEIGISPSYYFHTRIKQVTDLESFNNVTKSKDSFIHRFHEFAVISFGFNYQINEKLSWFSQPVFRYQLNALFDAPLKEHLFAVGLETGVRWEFGNSSSKSKDM